jgi:hypothetical protein
MSSPALQTPGSRIASYFLQYKTKQERCHFMNEHLLDKLSPKQKEVFQTYNIISEKDKLITLLATHAEIRFSDQPVTRWSRYPILDIEAIAGIGQRYSTPAFSKVVSLLPQVIKTTSKNQKSSSFLELGGFGFNDFYNAIQPFEQTGIQIDSFTGVDIHQQGIIAADLFNQKVAKIANHTLICQDAFAYLSQAIKTKQHKENCMVAIRFLAVFSPSQIEVFFKQIKALLKSGDIFVFNHTLPSDIVYKIGNKNSKGYSLQTYDDMPMLFHNGEHIQTFLSPKVISDLLQKNDLKAILTTEEEIIPQGNSSIRRGFDAYSRATIFAQLKS